MAYPAKGSRRELGTCSFYIILRIPELISIMPSLPVLFGDIGGKPCGPVASNVSDESSCMHGDVTWLTSHSPMHIRGEKESVHICVSHFIASMSQRTKTNDYRLQIA
jgi:hypothetical protein